MLKHTKKLVSIAILLILISLSSLSIPYIANASTVPIIVIDPGHGGRQTGVIGLNGLREKTVNLKVALRLRSYLKAAGARVIMTRTRDRTLSLASRVSIARQAGATRFISIHHNSAVNRRVNGTETYVRRGTDSRSIDMAIRIQRSLLKYLGHRNRGVHRAGFYVLRKTRMPAVLTEASFISNRVEASRMRLSSYIDKEARAIFFGVRAHMNFKPSYSPVAIQGTAAPAQEIYYPHVTDTNRFWRSLVSVKNTATTTRKDITISLYEDSGNLLRSKNLTLNPEQTYNFYPRKILGGNFGGSIKVSTSSANLVGKLTQVSKSDKAIASVQGLTPSNELHIPSLVDTSNWHSFIAVMNTSGSPASVTVDYYNNTGSLIQFNVTVNSQAKYYFRPMNSIGSVFNGSATITSTEPLVAYVSRVNTSRTRLGIAPAVEKAANIYFAKAIDNSTWRDYLTIQNTGDSSKQTTIYAYRSNGSLRRQETVSIAARAKYKKRVASLAGSNFDGALKIIGQDSSLAAYLTQSNRNASALGIIEGQQGLQRLYFTGVTDNTYWNSEVATSNVASSATVDIRLFSFAGTQKILKSSALNINGSYSFFPFELINQGFDGSIKISAPASQLVGYLAQYR